MVDIPGPNVWYLGLFRVDPATVHQLHVAQNRATRTVDRSRVKLLEGVVCEYDLRKELHVRPPPTLVLPSSQCMSYHRCVVRGPAPRCCQERLKIERLADN